MPRTRPVAAWFLVIPLAIMLSATTAQPSAQRGEQAPAPPPVDVQSLGPKVGAIVPDFSLRDQDGRTRSLDSLMGPKGLMLVFFRSADW